MRTFEYRHVIPFDETNLVGNVYFVNHVRWQGHCREMFLRAHAPDVLQQLSHDLRLVTVRCSCEYIAELNAFDEVMVQMRLHGLVQNRIALDFEYWRQRDGARAELIARGQQEIACMVWQPPRLVPTPVPASLKKALHEYAPAVVSA